MEREQRVTLIRIIISAVLLAVAIFVPMPLAAKIAVYAAAYLAVAYDILLEAAEGIAHGEVFDENFLMAVASIGAIVLAAMRGDGDYNEAVAVVLLYKVGEFFEDFAVDRSRDSITDLMDLRPDYANVEAGGRLERVDPDTVEVGSVIVVQPGEKIPLDGVVEEGRSALNVSALTGESVPRDVEPGDEVVSGSVNTSGLLRVRVTRAFGESTASRILRLVEESAERKSRSEKFISRFARVYTPLVCVAALLLALIPPVISMAMGLEPGWQTWIYRALTFLVISCPCALVISIPLTFFAGIGGAGREGILIKGSNYMEALNRVRTVVFDKTGTLTEGEFSVSGVHHSPVEESVVIEYAALAECASTHPISRSILAAGGGEPDRSRVTGIEEISGQGVRATVDGRKVAVGNSKLMESIGVEYRDCHHAGTVVHVAMDGDYAGHILVSDQIKEGSAEAVEDLRRAGVGRIVMLTGDSAGVADKVASELGITEVRAELLPEDKVAELEKLLLSQKKADRTAFAGDGINDAPVLSRADLGIAMGALGSDAAIEAADVVLMDDDPRKVAKAIRIARKCMRIVRQNIVFALAVKLVCLTLGALGLANMWIAVFADVGVMILAVANATRAMRVRGV